MESNNPRAELPLEPDRPIVDAHHHLWVEPPVPQFDTYDGDAVIADQRSGHNIVASIYVEAQSHYRQDGPQHLKPVGETEYIDAFAERAGQIPGAGGGACAGIVAHADLLLGEAVDEVLNAHAAASPRRFVGIRHRTPFDPDVPDHSGQQAGLLADPRFRRGFSRLAPAGLVFDAMIFQSQLSEVADLAAAFEATRIVVNHLGGPIGIGRFSGHREEGFNAWREGMRRLAEHDNVYVKLGGLNMHFTGVANDGPIEGVTSDQLVALQRDHILTAIEMFGPERCMFESNFPVDKLTVPYGALWNVFKKIVSDFSEPEKEHLFQACATNVYGMTDKGRPA